MQIRPIALLKGIATFVPGAMKFACGGSGGTDSARYCYSAWLRHLAYLTDAGVNTRFETIAELGPGDSIGIGLSAMLTGVNRYFAFDALPHARTSTNLQTFDRLLDLFARGEEIGDGEFPELWPPPIRRAPIAVVIVGNRVAAIREALRSSKSNGIELRYCAPWNDTTLVEANSVDLIFSQAVLEHVEDIGATYAALFRWLKPGGVMSHQIDFRSHSITRDWYGHWTLSPVMWRLVKGRRPYLINRLPASAHVGAMEQQGFEILQQIPQHALAPPRHELAAEFRGLSDDDLQTSALYVIARKPLS